MMRRQVYVLMLLMYVLSLVLASVAVAGDPAFLGWWKFDDGAGTVAKDDSGNGYDGTVYDAAWVAGNLGGALAFTGAEYVDVPAESCSTIDMQLTVAFWTFIDFTGDQWPFTFGAFTDPANNEARAFSGHLPWADGNVYFDTGGPGFDRIVKAVTEAEYANAWVHWAFVKDAETGDQQIFRNGVLWHSGTGMILPLGGADVTKFTIGCKPSIENFYTGMIDDFRLYSRVLTADDLADVMLGKGSSAELAGLPNPASEATDVPRDMLLTWEAGEFAVAHDVYLGTAFDDVNDAGRANPMDVLVSQGQATATYQLSAVLEYGQTYYWRIDEVNGAPDNTIFRGEVWSFTVEPVAYPIATVTATSNVESQPGVGPENTVNGSGLNESDAHSVESGDMWQASPLAEETLSIQYEFDQVYKLHEMLVWNYNVQFELMLGFGLKDVTVEYSEDGQDWATLGDIVFNQATAAPTYTANTIVAFDGVAAKYVRLTVNSGYGPMGQFGLSEVRFLYVPVQAREPEPGDGTVVAVDTDLNWRAGREAVSHEVYLGTDPNVVELIDTTGAATVDLGALDLGVTYYWKIDEVNEAEAISVWEGAIWSFSTEPYLVVEDFEAYNDEDNLIYETWIDGWVNETGSTVGHLQAPFAEQTIVHGGEQSMPLFFDNAGVATSEAEFALSQDWSVSGIRSLSLQFFGDRDNSGQLYVKINNTKVPYDGDASDIGQTAWQPWNVDLSAVGGNLSSVTSLTIGVEGAGASGVVYIDDIRLYPKAPEYYTPADPGNANLAGHWNFDEGAGEVAADVSGNGNDGTLVNTFWQAGQIGSALEFSGLNSYANIPAAAWSTIERQATVAVWLYVDSSVIQSPVTFAAYQDSTNGNTRVMSTHIVWSNSNVYLDTGGDPTGYDRISKPALPSDYADAWIHWAFTKNADTGEQKIYRNGILWHSGTELTRPMTGVTAFTLGANTANNAEFWNGAMDDFRLYNKELMPEELLWLAGKTTPVAKPF